MEISLSEKYHQVRARRDFPEEQLFTNRYDFDMALHDLNACLSCKGTCKTMYNKSDYVDRDGNVHNDYTVTIKGFVALHKNDSKQNKMPMFRFFFCPGVVERKEDIKKWVLGGR